MAGNGGITLGIVLCSSSRAALAVVLHTGDLTAAYFGKGWKKMGIFAVLGSREPLPVSKQCLPLEKKKENNPERRLCYGVL